MARFALCMSTTVAVLLCGCHSTASHRTAASPTPAHVAVSASVAQATAISTTSSTPAAIAPPQIPSFGSGTKIVGRDLSAGTYESGGGGSCYWERERGFGGTNSDIIANDNPRGSAVVTIAPSDAGFKSSGCGTWTLVQASGSATNAATGASATSPLPLSQFALQPDDLPPGFALTAPGGPGGADLGAVTSYQEEFQQQNVTSSQSLQQTLIVISLLSQYPDPSSALSNLQNVNGQSLNRLLGISYNGLAAEPAEIPAIEEDSKAFHFGGDTGGKSIGGYMVLFHRGSVAVMIMTAAVKGAESLPLSIDIAQKQAQRLQAIQP